MSDHKRVCKVCGGKYRLFLRNLFDDRYGAAGKHSIDRCIKCGFGRCVPGLKEKEISKYYAKYYPLKSVTAESVKKSANIPSRWLSWLKGTDNTAHWYISNNSKVLDIGCGSGVSLLEIEKLGGTPYGVEPDPNAQKIAKKLNLHIHQGFITDNFFPEIKFDYLTASQVIEHEPKPKEFMKTARKKLKDQGLFILSCPNFDAFYRKIFNRRWLHWHVPYHVNFFTRKSFEILTESSGFKINRIRTITPNLWTILQLRMLFSRTLEGEPNPIWVKVNNKTEYHWLPAKVFSILYYFMYIFLYIVITPFNRILDSIGQGESFLVFLRKKT